MKKKSYYLTAATAMLLAGNVTCINAWADDAYDINNGPANIAVTYDSYSGAYPVVTAVLSAPVGALDGYTYGNWSFLAADSTGSLDVFGSSTVAGLAGYTPTVGDSLSINGYFSPFDGIPEIENSTKGALSVTKISSGAGPGATVGTIPVANANSSLPNGVINTPLAGQYVELDDITIGNSTGNPDFPVHANASYTLTDSGGNSMVMFFWASSYSTDGAMGGSVIPTGSVDMDGFLEYFAASSEAEFVATTITPLATPEPSVLNLFGMGGAGSVLAWALRSRKKA